MNPRLFTIIRLVACVLTILSILGQKYLPQKSLDLYPRANNVYSIYADDHGAKHSEVSWVNEDKHHWRCTLRETSQQAVCGMSISFSPIPYALINLDSYDSIQIDLDYQGDASRVRIFIRNNNSAYSTVDEIERSKFQFVNISVPALIEKPTSLSLNNFSVSDWWVEQYNIPLEHSQLDFSEVISIGIDQVAPTVYGTHEYKLNSIKLTGNWISAEKLYIILILAWMAVLSIEAISRLVNLNYRAKRDERRLQELKQESDKYKELSNTDELTGVSNRVGLKQKLADINESSEDLSSYVLTIIDIDHFKSVNDKHGHVVGDIVLKGIASAVENCIRSEDFLARWGGEEFVILSHHEKSGTRRILSEKIRALVENLQYDVKTPLKVTISLGVARGKQNESFENLFKRADRCLFKAKESGRNCIVFADS